MRRKQSFWKPVNFSLICIGLGCLLMLVVFIDSERIQYMRKPAPEGGMRFDLTIGGMTAEQLKESLDEKKINISSYARSMLRNKKEFIDPVTEREKKRGGVVAETLHLVRLRVRDLGFTSPPTTTELFARAKERGLDLCPPEAGPYLRLADEDQPLGTGYLIGMEPVTDSDGNPSVFSLGRGGGGLWLYYYWAFPDDRWALGYPFVFRSRKSDT